MWSLIKVGVSVLGVKYLFKVQIISGAVQGIYDKAPFHVEHQNVFYSCNWTQNRIKPLFLLAKFSLLSTFIAWAAVGCWLCASSPRWVSWGYVLVADRAEHLLVAPGHASAVCLLCPVKVPWWPSQGQVLLCLLDRNWTRNNPYTELQSQWAKWAETFSTHCKDKEGWGVGERHPQRKSEANLRYLSKERGMNLEVFCSPFATGRTQTSRWLNLDSWSLLSWISLSECQGPTGHLHKGGKNNPGLLLDCL